jgi:hypothetical protein
MTKSDFSKAIEEISRLAAYDRYDYDQKEHVENDDCLVGGQVVGRLSELPTWAQAYIKSLRSREFSATHEVSDYLSKE